MKIRFGFPAIYLLTLVLIVSSCKNNHSAGRYIPSDALMAVQVNVSSLSAKLPWREIKNNPLFNDMYSTDSVWIKNLPDSPATSGIDTDKEMVFFIQKENNGGYTAIEGAIKDEAAFKSFCTRITGNATITEIDGVNYISRYPACVGFNGDRFVYITDAPGLQRMDDLHRRMKVDSIDITAHQPRDLKAICQSVFNLEEKKSLAADEKFSSVLKEQGDLHIWLNTEDFYKDVKLPGMLSFVDLQGFFKGSAATAVVNFENGAVKMNAHSYSNKELTKIYEKFSGGKVNEEMLKRIPGKDVAAVLALNFKPQALMEIIKLINLDGIINTAASVAGFNTDDFIKANKGDVVVGLSDVKMMNDSAQTAGEFIPAVAIPKPSFNTVFAVSVADKNSFDKLMTSGKKIAGTFIDAGEMPVFYSYNKNYFALSNKQVSADTFMNGAGNNHEFISKIKGSPVAGYLNLQSVIKSFESFTSKDSSMKVVYDASLKMWDNILLKGGEVTNGALHYSIEINMMDKNTNSLQQLHKYAAAIGEANNRQKRKELEDMRAMQDALAPVEEPTKK